MGTLGQLDFYITPILGKRFADQLAQMRESNAAVGGIVRGAYYDKSDNITTHVLSGLAYGKENARLKFRWFYDKSVNTDQVLLQVNTGTDASPSWQDVLAVRESDRRVTIKGAGGLLAQQGFYNLGGLNVDVTQAGGAAFSNVGTLRFDSNSGFYLTPDSSGRPILSVNVAAASGTVTQGLSLGSGSDVFKNKTSATLNFRSLTEGTNMSFTQSANEIEIATDAEVNTSSNLGSGEGVFSSKSGVDLRFKSLVGGSGVSLSSDSNEITISAPEKFYGITVAQTDDLQAFKNINTVKFNTDDFYISQQDTDTAIVNFRGTTGGGGGSGEANTASNLGSGEGVFSSKSGVDLRFKSLVGKGKIKLSSDSNEVTIAPEFYLNDLEDVSAGSADDGNVLGWNGSNWAPRAVNEFYGITVAQTDDLQAFKNINTVKFNTDDFYVSQQDTDTAIVNFRGTTGGGGGSGEANTASNLGSGEGVFSSKSGVDLQFKSLVATGKIKLSSDSSEITIAPEFYLNDLEDVSAGGPQDGDLIRFSSDDDDWRSTGNGENLLVNGDMRFAQRGDSGSASFTSATSPANNDDSYLLDQWILVSDGNDTVDVSQQTSDLPDGASHKMRLDQETGSQQFGIVQPIESDQSIALRGKYVTFSGYVQRSDSSFASCRAAVLSWNGTGDSITSDVVSSWSDGSNATLASNWSYIDGTKQPKTVTVTTSWTRFSTTIKVPSDATNVAVFLYVLNSGTVGHFLEVTNCKLEVGLNPSAFEMRPASTELARCQRYYCKTFDIDTAPEDGIAHRGLHGKGASSSGVIEPHAEWTYPQTMRTNPTVTLYNSRSGGTAGEWQVGSSDSANARVLNANDTTAIIDNSGVTTGSAGDQAFIGATADASL